MPVPTIEAIATGHNTASTSSQSTLVTTTANTDFMVVFVGYKRPSQADNVANVTYNSVNLTRVSPFTSTINNNLYIDVWKLSTPPVSTLASLVVTVTTAGAISVATATMTGVTNPGFDVTGCTGGNNLFPAAAGTYFLGNSSNPTDTLMFSITYQDAGGAGSESPVAPLTQVWSDSSTNNQRFAGATRDLPDGNASGAFLNSWTVGAASTGHAFMVACIAGIRKSRFIGRML